MTIPFWCVALGVLLPYVFPPFSFAERKEVFGAINLNQPRSQVTGLRGRGARAMGAHANAFEGLAVFVPAVVIAHLAGANATHAAGLAVAWVVFRTLHGFFYLSDLPLFRSMAFAAGMLCTFGLFGIAAVA